VAAAIAKAVDGWKAAAAAAEAALDDTLSSPPAGADQAAGLGHQAGTEAGAEQPQRQRSPLSRGGRVAGGRYRPSRSSRELMTSYLAKGAAEANSPVASGTPVKRGREQGSPGDSPAQKKDKEDTDDYASCIEQEEEEQQDSMEGEGDIEGQKEQEGRVKAVEAREEAEWEQKLREAIEAEVFKAQQRGQPLQVDNIMGLVTKSVRGLLDQLTEKVTRDVDRRANAVYEDNSEARMCRRSVLIHNADKWVEGDTATAGYNLAERVTAAVHRTTRGMTSVTGAFSLGRGQDNQGPSSCFLSFGSVTQKSTFFKVLAATVKAGGREGHKLKVISCRDAFPKKRVNDSKMLVQKGMALRREGRIAYFRVIAQGNGCIPVLEVKHWLGSGGQVSARWEVFIGEERPPPAVPMPVGNNRGRGGRGGGVARGGVVAGGSGATGGSGAARGGNRDGGGARGGVGGGATRGGNGGGGQAGAAGSRVGGGGAGNGGQSQGHHVAAGRGGRGAATGRPPMTPRSDGMDTRPPQEEMPEQGFPGMLETIEHGHFDEEEGEGYREPY